VYWRLRRWWARRGLREEFRSLRFAGQAMQKLLDEYAFVSVLDIGSGEGEHARVFAQHGKRVTCIDRGLSRQFAGAERPGEVIIGDYLETHFDAPFDCIWASHVLEHQPNPHTFLIKVHGDLEEGGILALTVPPRKDQIVGGHLSLWNAGLLLYHLVLAGFDTSAARVRRYGYNISVLLTKRSIVVPELSSDFGDLTTLAPYLPPGLTEPFDGDIRRLNW